MRTKADTPQAVSEIRAVLGTDAVSTDDDILHLHGYSSWSTINVDRLPIAVVYPRNTNEVVATVKLCHNYRVPMSTSVFSYLLRQCGS